MFTAKCVCSLFLACVFVSSVSAAARKLPKGWKRCQLYDPSVKECLKPAIEGAVKDLLPGNPNIGVPTLDPLHLNVLNIDQQNNGPVSINLTFFDIDILGIKDFKIDKISEVDWGKHYLSLDASFLKPVSLIGKYSIDGKVLILPISGNGDSEFVFENLKAKLEFKGKIIKTGNEEHVEINQLECILSCDNLKMRLDNLFNGDKALGDNMNKFLNENSQEIFNELKFSISKSFGEAIRQITNSFYKRVPLSSIGLN